MNQIQPILSGGFPLVFFIGFCNPMFGPKTHRVSVESRLTEFIDGAARLRGSAKSLDVWRRWARDRCAGCNWGWKKLFGMLWCTVIFFPRVVDFFGYDLMFCFLPYLLNILNLSD